ncbi:hypothetical protein EJ08DRAFT_675469 [Tothia fuscella]|uniref:Uncharacterized protein n=1 Tax=Tothia fuscella TaxID=1048955 RepID=A0A9P4P0J8_9PEZI|nr:hypothetical protein EJ08DRAFT_675469 [Tothia fuscella]
MTGVLLFCTAEDAKPLIRKVMHNTNDKGELLHSSFYLIQGNDLPDDSDELKSRLTQEETFTSVFIGASEQNCRDWMLEKQKQVNYVEINIFAIADAESVKDNTLLVQFYYPEFDPPLSPMEFPGYGILPPRTNAWYSYRIQHDQFDDLHAALCYLAPDIRYPIYFGRKAELTDEQGIFDVARADGIIAGKEPFTPPA